jgi:hypothetical protein
MNIFYVDRNPYRAARALHDKHVVKMVLETAQILSTVLDRYGVSGKYRPTHRNHPVVKWAAESRANFEWLCHHGMALAAEYTYRYERQHASTEVILWASRHNDHVAPGPFTEPPQCMPEGYRGDDAVEAYRLYYRLDKLLMSRWTKRDEPDWLWRKGA